MFRFQNNYKRRTDHSFPTIIHSISIAKTFIIHFDQQTLFIQSAQETIHSNTNVQNILPFINNNEDSHFYCNSKNDLPFMCIQIDLFIFAISNDKNKK